MAARLLMEHATFNARLADRTAAVEAPSFRDRIVVRANDEFVITPAASPNHILADIECKDIKEGAVLQSLTEMKASPGSDRIQGTAPDPVQLPASLLLLNTTGVTLGTTDEPSSPNPPSLVVDLIEGIVPVSAPPLGSITAWRADMYQGKKLFINIYNDKRVERQPSTPEWSIRSFPCINHTPHQAWTWYHLPGSCQWLAFNCYTVYLHKPMGQWWRMQEDSLDSSLPLPVRPSIPHQSAFILAKLSLQRMTQIKGGDVTSRISAAL